MSKSSEQAAANVHNVALREAHEYATSHGGSAIEEVAFGRGYKIAYIKGYEQAERDTLDRVCEWLEKNISYVDPSTHKLTGIVNLWALREAITE